MNIYILREIAGHDRELWKMFSMLNKELNKYFNIEGIEYELCFRRIITTEYYTEYKLNGLSHRTDGPAIIFKNGEERWFRSGLLHRIDGPAFIAVSGTRSWYNNGLVHRIGGPARIFGNDYEEWWNEGLIHRLDGPARTYKFENKTIKEYWINGFRVKPF